MSASIHHRHDPLLLPHLEATHPLTAALSTISFWAPAPKGEVQHRFKWLIKHLAVPHKECVYVVAFGVSVTQGQGCCQERMGCQQNCSFVTRFVQLIRGAYPKACIIEENRAVAASTSSAGLSTLEQWISKPFSRPTVVLMDYSVNDMYDHPQVMATAAEVWMMLLLQRSRYIVPVHLEIFPGLDVGNRSSWVDPHASKERMARHYGVPALLYYRLVPWWYTCSREKWPGQCQEQGLHGERESTKEPLTPWWNIARRPNLRRPERKLNTPWASYRHPFASTHQLIAEALAMAWDHWTKMVLAASEIVDGSPEQSVGPPGETRAALPSPLSDARSLLSFAVCSSPASSFSTGMIPGVSSDGNWTYYEEAPNKPGYITMGPAGAQIEFTLRFEAEVPFFRVTYLQGYDLNGSVRLKLTSGQHVVEWETLHAKRRDDERVSQAAVFTGVSDSKHGKGISRNSTQVMTAKLVSGSKFKIISVLAC
jgi:hypothetical protein